MFWAFTIITAAAVLALQSVEDQTEKKKEGPYDNGWRDDQSMDNNLYAKVSRANSRLSEGRKHAAADEADVAASATREAVERAECADTAHMRERYEELRQASAERRAVREEVVAMVTGATEEREALPEELTSRLNKILYNVDEIDAQTQRAVETQSVAMAAADATSTFGQDAPCQDSLPRGAATAAVAEKVAPPALSPRPAAPQKSDPRDSAGHVVALPTLRNKLGSFSRSTLLRLVNLGTQPLRLESGRILQAGLWVDRIDTRDTGGRGGVLDLGPPALLRPTTETVVAGRSSGSSWLPTSGVEGSLVYVSADGAWKFTVIFGNLLARNKRTVHVKVENIANMQPHAGTSARTELTDIYLCHVRVRCVYGQSDMSGQT